MRASHPETPIVLTECLRFQGMDFKAAGDASAAAISAAMHLAVDRVRSKGIGNLHVVKADELLGRDGEGTVDGIHATDLGFMRIADVLTPVLAELV